MQPCSTKLFPYGVSKCLNVRVKFLAKLKVPVAMKSILYDFIVVANQCDSLLDAKSAKEFGILKIVEPSTRLCANVNKDNFEYSVHFTGKLKKIQLKFHVHDKVKPVVKKGTFQCEKIY